MLCTSQSLVTLLFIDDGDGSAQPPTDLGELHDSADCVPVQTFTCHETL